MAKHNRKGSFPTGFSSFSFKSFVSGDKEESEDIKTLPFTITQ